MTDILPDGRVADRLPRYRGTDAHALTLDTWQDAPHNRWAFSNVRELVPTVEIAHRAPVAAEPPLGLGRLGDALPDLQSRLESTFADALVVLHRGDTVAEWYADGLTRDHQHLLMSVSKSVCGLVIGTLVDDGIVDVGRAIASYVPALEGTGYGDATVQQVLDMTADIDYSEDYRDPASHVQTQDRVAGWRPRLDGDPADTYEFLAGLNSLGEHGQRFRYYSAGTDVLAWLIESVTCLRYADAVSERLWSRLGCERPATITVDDSGFAFANGGLSCTARDLARVGQLMLDGGTARGERIVSRAWVERSLTGGSREAAAGTIFQRVHPHGSYANQWWVTGNDRGNTYASGIYGQFIWIDPPTQTVIVKFSSCPEPVTEAWNRTHAELFGDLCQVFG
ncbi:MAG: serine hydrolase domain-containing protein [Pseudoclavibacter sp.]